jgi:hypothetical protein
MVISLKINSSGNFPILNEGKERGKRIGEVKLFKLSYSLLDLNNLEY